MNWKSILLVELPPEGSVDNLPYLRGHSIKLQLQFRAWRLRLSDLCAQLVLLCTVGRQLVVKRNLCLFDVFFPSLLLCQAHFDILYSWSGFSITGNR